MRHLIFFLVSLSLLSCSKTENHPADSVFTLTNSRNYQVNVDLYKTKEDRINEVNKVYSCVIPAKGSYGIPLAKLDSQTKYQYDIYSNDYRYSNWPSDNGTGIFDHGNALDFDIANYTISGARYYFLRGDNVKTTWKAVNRFISANFSDWSMLSDLEKQMQMEVFRDEKVCLYYYQPSFVSYVHDTGYITTAIDQQYYTGATITGIGTSRGSYFFLYSISTVPTNDSTTRNSLDTLQLNYNGTYWMMVRQ